MSRAEKSTLRRTKSEEKIIDPALESMLRPASFKEYVGQDRVKKNLRMIVAAAKKRRESVDHLLFCGQAGLGKTTLAMLVAKEMGGDLRITSGTVIEKTGDLAAILSTLNDGDVLFIDEAHRIQRTIEEMLYPAMDARQLHLIIGKGPASRMMTLDLPSFTLIAATTRTSLLSSPLRSRFGAVFKLDYYTLEDMEQIIKRSARILGVAILPEAIKTIACASRCTPRVANRLLKRVRDLSEVTAKSPVDVLLAREALALFEIDEMGLEESDRRLLRILIEKFNGGPVGLSTLAASLDEDRGTIEDVYEPYLLKTGFLSRTPKGRVATRYAYAHLKYRVKDGT